MESGEKFFRGVFLAAGWVGRREAFKSRFLADSGFAVCHQPDRRGVAKLFLT